MICAAWRTSAALFLLLDGIVGIELARVGAIVAGICVAFACSAVFLSADRRALELSRALRKRLSGPSEATAQLAPVRIVAAE